MSSAEQQLEPSVALDTLWRGRLSIEPNNNAKLLTSHPRRANFDNNNMC